MSDKVPTAEPILLAGVAGYLVNIGMPGMAQLIRDAIAVLEPFENADGSVPLATISHLQQSLRECEAQRDAALAREKLARTWVRELIDRHLDDSDTSTGVWHVFNRRLADTEPPSALPTVFPDGNIPHADPPYSPPFRHLVHCNAGAKTRPGEGICICLHELRTSVVPAALPTAVEPDEAALCATCGGHGTIWRMHARGLSTSDAPEQPIDIAKGLYQCGKCNGTGRQAQKADKGSV